MYEGNEDKYAANTDHISKYISLDSTERWQDTPAGTENWKNYYNPKR